MKGKKFLDFIFPNSPHRARVNVALLLGRVAFAVLMGYYYSLYHFVDRSTRTAVYILLVPVLAHGIYDAIALTGTVDASIGALAAFALIYFCVKMHKFAKKKMMAQIDRDKNKWTFKV